MLFHYFVGFSIIWYRSTFNKNTYYSKKNFTWKFEKKIIQFLLFSFNTVYEIQLKTPLFIQNNKYIGINITPDQLKF